MCYYLARRLTDNLNGFNAKIVAIREFVHENVHPISGYDNRLDTVAIEKLLTGIGWCDQQSRVFMQLSEHVGITSRLLFLRAKDSSSPHSVAEVLSPDNRWLIVDTAYNLDLVNADGSFATQSDIKNNLAIIANNKRVMARARFSDRWSDETYLSIYHNTPIYVVTKKSGHLDPLRLIPVSWLRPIVAMIHTIYIETLTSHMKDADEADLLRARGLHLLEFYERSGILYEDVITRSNNPKLVSKAEFYYALLLKDQKKFKEACDYLTDILNKKSDNSYHEYLRGERARILEKMGMPREAENDLMEIKYALDPS